MTGLIEDDGGSSEDEVEKLESDVKQMAQKLLEYRTTLPDQLRSILTSVLTAQRPVFPDPSEPPNPDAGGQAKDSEGRLCAEEDQETAEKLRLLKDKISSNVSAMPIVLKRMKECISRIDKLDSNNGIIHPAFKRKKTS
ncbi:Packaging protein [Fagus crenata]